MHFARILNNLGGRGPPPRLGSPYCAPSWQLGPSAPICYTSGAPIEALRNHHVATSSRRGPTDTLSPTPFSLAGRSISMFGSSGYTVERRPESTGVEKVQGAISLSLSLCLSL